MSLPEFEILEVGVRCPTECAHEEMGTSCSDGAWKQRHV